MNGTDALEFDIDLRIVKIWGQVGEELPDTHALLGALLRAAYGKGYCDALKEPVRGQMLIDHGYPNPGRQCS